MKGRFPREELVGIVNQILDALINELLMKVVVTIIFQVNSAQLEKGEKPRAVISCAERVSDIRWVVVAIGA
jgi:hypothetical protein